MIAPHDSIIVKKITRILVPLIQIYGLYVLFHGHDSPGGGFQGGVLLGGSIILAALTAGTGIRQALRERAAILWSAVGLAIYAGVGLVSLAWGGEYLNYARLPWPYLDAAFRRYFGILGIEIGVFTAVAATIVSIFYILSPQERKERSDE